MKAFFFGVLMLLGALLFLTWIRVEVIHLGYVVTRLEKERQGLLERKKELTLEKELLTSPKELEQRAIEELGMKYPEDKEVLIIGD